MYFIFFKEFRKILILSSEKKFIGNHKRLYVKYKRFAKDVKIGEKLLIDDGKLIFEILETDNKHNVKARIFGKPAAISGPLDLHFGEPAAISGSLDLLDRISGSP